MKSAIVNIHIPKTAGTALRRRVWQSLPEVHGRRAVIGIDQIIGYRTHEPERLGSIMDEGFGKLSRSFPQIVSGHYLYREIADHVAARREQLILVTSLRDPVDRFISDYLYNLSDRSTERDAFITQFPSFDAYLAAQGPRDKQYRYLRPARDATVLETIDHVKRNFDFVALTERLDADLDLFLTRLGLRPAPPFRLNEGPDRARFQELRDRHGDAIAEANSADLQLYEALSAVDWGDTPIDFVGSGVAAGTAAPVRPVLPEADARLLDELVAMGPWHHDIDLNPDVWTGLAAVSGAAGNETGAGRVSLTRPAAIFANQILPFFPDGMAGKSFLDCGCNAGGYCFAARDAGAERTFGFDVRQHWIDQARFVAARRKRNSDGMQFEVADLLALEAMDEMFDVTWFSGLLYHLPDPVRGLRIAADRTRDLLLVNTAVAATQDGPPERLSMELKFESRNNVMSGVHELAWLPSGPKVLQKILADLGFAETKLLFWLSSEAPGRTGPRGRLAIVAARSSGRLADPMTP
ncbi:MAG: methyltransferase domain-containing protein [Rubellimicrobium sp.]|nr:methyltransferase domain-containing protein [Rubellimicrobium sp.]